MSVPAGSCSHDDAEAWVLTDPAGHDLLTEVARLREPRPADIDRWRKHAPPHIVAAAIRLAACRARARAKFSRGNEMWLDSVGLEQATAEAVALHKAAASPVHWWLISAQESAATHWLLLRQRM